MKKKNCVQPLQTKQMMIQQSPIFFKFQKGNYSAVECALHQKNK